MYYIIKYIKNYNYLTLNKIFLTMKLLIFLYKNIKINFKRLIFNKVFYRVKLRKILGLVKFKFFEIYLENIIYKFYSIFYKIYINNIYIQKGLYLRYKINLKYKYNNWLIFQTLLISIIYNSTKIISDYIANMIALEKNHNKVLKTFVSLIEQMFFLNIVKLVGFQLRLNGKLAGKMRKSKYHYKIGLIQRQTLYYKLNYSLVISYTKFGSISVKS